MTPSDDSTPRSWTAPDAGLTAESDSAADHRPDWGSGLAWLGARSPAAGTRPPVAPAGGRSTASPLTRTGIWSADEMAETAQRSHRDPIAGPPADYSAGRPGMGGVVTWLPDGRWVTDDATEPADRLVSGAPATGGPAGRRGRRRLALARFGARVAGWPRRVAVGVLLLAAVLAALRPAAGTTGPPAPPTAEVVVTARDVPAGTVFGAADLRIVAMPVPATPDGAVRRPAALLGRVAAGPLRRGEAVTDARVVGPGLSAGLGPGETAVVPVRIADPETAALVRAGDRIDVLGTRVDVDGMRPADDAVEVAARLRVLAVLGGRDTADGVVLVVAAAQQTARRLAGAAARHRLTVSLRPP